MAMLGGMSNHGLPGNMMPGFNSGHSAQMQQMYGGPQQTPLNERPFKCDQCPQSFNRNHDLKRHKRIHLAVKPFPCGHCDKSFSRKDALKVSFFFSQSFLHRKLGANQSVSSDISWSRVVGRGKLQILEPKKLIPCRPLGSLTSQVVTMMTAQQSLAPYSDFEGVFCFTWKYVSMIKMASGYGAGVGMGRLFT